LTIELREEIPGELREGVGDRIYGCDVCQDVCPYNIKFSQALHVPEFRPRAALASNDARMIACEVLAMSQEEFTATLKGSAMKRAKLRGLKRNAAVVLGNVGTAEDADVLMRALGDEEPLVREHAKWALRRVVPAPAD
jgi:epoxyqueuosine reductase